MTDPSTSPAAYGGPGWSPRRSGLRDELGTLWGACGLSNEWGRLRRVLVHTPGIEWASLSNANAAQMLARPDLPRARRQHQQLIALYERLGVEVAQIAPPVTPPPNLLFAADLFVMTPSGAVLGRPASTVRAGEERWVARRLADLGVPILLSVHGTGTFEGADLMWLEPDQALIGIGLRTNVAGADQVAGLEATLARSELPTSAMHLMGQLRILDRDLAVVWPDRVDETAHAALTRAGYVVHPVPDPDEAARNGALNVVTVGPREIVMPTCCPRTQRFYEDLGVVCHTTAVDELLKAAGGIACMTGILHREAAN